MVKTPKTRHSKPQKEPMTIDLEPESVERVPDPEEKSAVESAQVFEAAETTIAPEAGAAAESGGTDTTTSDTDDQFIGSEWPPEQPAAPETASFGRGTPDSRVEPEAAAARNEAAPAATPLQAEPPRRSASSLVAGVVGGALALAGVTGLQFAGIWPGNSATPAASDTDAVAALQAELAALKQEIATIKGASGGDTSALETAVAESTSRIDRLNAALEALKTDFTALRSDFQSSGADDAGAIESLDVRLAELEKTLASFGQGSGPAPAELAALSGKIAAVEAAVRAANEAFATNDGRLAALEQGIGDLKARVDALGDQPKVALALAAASLKAALERGGSFTAEVETFAAVAPDAPELAELRRIAADGVASRPQLVAEMADAADAMIAAGRVVDENAGFFQRLWSSAESLISVRPIGAVEGPGVPETVARMEQAVKDGDLAKALAEYDTLSEPAKAAGVAFVDKVRARLAAEALVDKALAAALKAA